MIAAATRQRPAPTPLDAALGGLLHDVGKAMQRARPKGPPPPPARDRAGDVLPSYKGRPSHWHALWTDAFFDWVAAERLPWPRDVDPAWVRDLAVFHHRPLQASPEEPYRVATLLTQVADRVSAGLDRKPKDEVDEAEGGPAAFRRTPLDAILMRIRLTDRRDGEAVPRPAAAKGVHLPRPLDPDQLAPVAPADGGAVERAYSDLWTSFTEGWRAMAFACAGDAVAFEEGALDLSERFFWAVPSSTMDQPDVSLHDHARVVAAVAACLCAHHAARGELADPAALTDALRPRLRFLVADLSGLQTTLFRFRAEGVAGRNRILRGRSFRFQLIADAAARRVREAFALPAACVLQAAGGKVLMLLPELGDDGTSAILDPLRAEIDDWMARQYLGDLGLGLAVSPPFATRDLVREAHEADAAPSRDRARSVRDRLRIAVETAKLRQLEGPAAAVLSDLPIPHGPCVACGVKPAQKEDGRCPACDAEHALGQALPRARAVVVGAASATDRILGIAYALPEGDAAQGARGWRLAAEAIGPAPLRSAAAYVARFGADTAAYAGLDEDEDIEAGGIKTFAALARDARIREPNGRARGVEMLGVLKADVDRLGALFATGLGDDAGLARPAQLSRMLDAYFTMRLTRLLASEFPDSYTVYAGGDDLMIVAPWRAALRLAARLRADFAAFAGESPSVTLSAGVALADPRAPLSIAATEAEDRLQRAKDAGRDRICAIEAAPMTWGEYEQALAAGDRLDAWLAGGRLATGALYKFLAFDDARARIAAAKPHDPSAADLGWRARLGYHLARMLPDRARREDQREVAAALLDLFGLDDRFADRQPRPGARLALSAALYANR